METNNEKNGADFGNKKNKNNKDFHPQYPFNIEKENLDLERIHSSFTKNTINSYPCLDLLKYN